MTQYLPPNLLALFAPRDPLPFIPPPDKLPHEKKTRGYLGVGNFLSHFEVGFFFIHNVIQSEFVIFVVMLLFFFLNQFNFRIPLKLHHQRVSKHGRNVWSDVVKKRPNKLPTNQSVKLQFGIQHNCKKPLKIPSKHCSSLVLYVFSHFYCIQFDNSNRFFC